MYQAMMRHSLTGILPRLILSLALAILLLALSFGNVATLISGAQDLNALRKQAQSGDYVSIDMSQLIASYSTLSINDQKIKEYYIVRLTGDEGDVYLSMCAPEKEAKRFERATSQSYDYYQKDSGIMNAMGLIRGTLTALDEEGIEMIDQWAHDSGLPGFSKDTNLDGQILPLELQLNSMGLLSPAWSWILFVLGVLCLIWFAAELGIALSGRYFQQVRAMLGNNVQAQEEWVAAESFGNARIGRDYIWYTNGPRTEVFSFKTVIWVYKQFDARVLGKYKWPISIFTSDRSYHELCVREDKEREKMIDILHAHGGCFVTGYNQDNYEQFCDDFDAFCARAAANDPDAGAPVIKLPD